MLRLVKWLCSEFKVVGSINIYWCFIQLIFEYGLNIWDPHMASEVTDAELHVQRHFLKFDAFRLNVPCCPYDYSYI